MSVIHLGNRATGVFEWLQIRTVVSWSNVEYSKVVRKRALIFVLKFLCFYDFYVALSFCSEKVGLRTTGTFKHIPFEGN